MNRKRLLCTMIVAGFVMLGGAAAVQAETLKEAIQKIIDTHPQVRTSAHNALARVEEISQARSGYYPKIDFSAGYGIQEVQEPVDESLNPEIITLSLRQNIFNGFATMNEVDRQQSRVNSESYRLHAITDLVALRTSEVYLSVLRLKALLGLAEKNLENHLRISDQIKLRSESGVSSTADREQVQGRVSLAQSNVISAKTNLEDGKSNYLAIVGNFPEGLVKPDSPDAALPASLDEALERALKEHPTFKSANADLEARHKQHEVAAGPYWPILDLEVDQNFEEDFDVEGSDDNLIVLLRLRYNIFNGFKDNARRAETTELIEEAREIKNNTERQVVESLRLSWMAYKAVQSRIPHLKNRVKATQSTADLYAKQFNVGKRTLLDVLDTEAEVIDAKRELVIAEYDELYAQYRVINGLGNLVKSFGLELPEETKLAVEQEKENSSDRG